MANPHEDDRLSPTNERIEYQISQAPDGRFIATVPGTPAIGIGINRSDAVLRCNGQYQDWLADQEVSKKKPRVWFYKRGTWYPGWKIIYFGGDEWDRHTLVIGSNWTGAMVIAYRNCPRTGKCAFMIDDDYPENWD